MGIHYSELEKNDTKYFVIKGIKISFAFVLANTDVDIRGDILEEIGLIYSKVFEYQHRKCKYNEYIDSILIEQDTPFGKYIEENEGLFINDSKQITYLKIVSAYDSAVLEDNSKMANKILPLFKTTDDEKRNEMIKRYDEDVKDYILANSNFFDFMNGKNKDKNATYYVYSEGNISKLNTDSEEKVLVKKRED